MFKVIIAGGRDLTPSFFPTLMIVCDHLLKNKTEVEIVSGKAKGADQLGEAYAKLKGYQIKEFPADWDNLGKSAGFKRNVQMAEYADALIAFWDGKSKGTKHMIDTAEKSGLQVKIINY